MCLAVWAVCVSIYHVRAVLTEVLEEGNESLRTELQPVLGCWDLNLGPLEKQPVLFTADPLSY